jgi:hypothetical protein
MPGGFIVFRILVSSGIKDIAPPGNQGDKSGIIIQRSQMIVLAQTNPQRRPCVTVLRLGKRGRLSIFLKCFLQLFLDPDRLGQSVSLYE